MGSQGPGSSGSSQSAPVVPPLLRKYYNTIARDYLGGMGNLPNITGLYNNTPLLGTAPLTDQQLSDIQGFQNNIGPNAAQNQSQQGYENFLGQNGKPSAATQAALKEFNDLQAPEIQSQAALQGLGNSGASLQALATGQEQALVPFMQQDLQNQLTATQGLGALGGQEAGQMQEQLQNALQAAGMPQQIAQEILQNQFNQGQQKWNFAQGIQTGGAQQFPSLFGQSGTSSQSSTSPKF